MQSSSEWLHGTLKELVLAFPALLVGRGFGSLAVKCSAHSLIDAPNITPASMHNLLNWLLTHFLVSMFPFPFLYVFKNINWLSRRLIAQRLMVKILADCCNIFVKSQLCIEIIIFF